MHRLPARWHPKTLHALNFFALVLPGPEAQQS
jgi:hypothetical protein